LFRVLIISRADTSRGPAVQYVLRSQLRTRGVEESIVLSSAGVLAAPGDAMHPHTVQALSELGVDPRGQVARRVTERRVALADLILTATREQRLPVAAIRADLAGRTFTVLEFARLAASLDAVPPAPARLVAVLADARDRMLPRSAADDDLEDPTGGGFTDHEQVVRRINLAARDVSRALAAAVQVPVARLA